MARSYCSLGKTISDFLDLDTYKLNRQATINVEAGDVSWSLKTKLQEDGKVDSDLTVKHSFPNETISLTTSKNKNPLLSIDSKRFKFFPHVLKIQDPEFRLNYVKKDVKYNVNVDTSYNWNDHNCDAEIGAVYNLNSNLNAGVSVKVERPNSNAKVAVSDYNVAFEYNLQPNKTIALTTETRTQVINVGGQVGFRQNYTGYGQVNFNRINNALGWALGLKYGINEDSHVSGVYRDNGVASLLYYSYLPTNHVQTNLGFNYDFTKKPAERATLEWKLIFG